MAPRTGPGRRAWKPTWTAIPNFIDTERFSPGRSGTPRAELGIPADAMGFDYLLAAAVQILPEVPELVVAGTGPQRELLEAEAGRFGVSEQVRFLGFQSDVQMALDLRRTSSRCRRGARLSAAARPEAMATEFTGSSGHPSAASRR